ncbi:hypothetical protein OX89_05845 [Diaphorobacter sp. J5-51]|nr:hypothetical protein OX89_05845 [Diaphorobacter sp. J5-51]
MRGGQQFQLRDAAVLDQQPAAPCLEQLHPCRDLDALVHSLRGQVQPCAPVHQLAAALRICDCQADALHRRALLFPLIEAQIPFDLQSGVEHALAGKHFALADFLRGPVGDDGDAVALGQKAKRQGKAGLSSADDCDVTHGNDLRIDAGGQSGAQLSKCVNYSARRGIAGTACSGPMAE